MKEIELSKLDMTLYYDKLKNGLEVYLLPYDNKNNYYMSYATRYGSETTTFVPAGEESDNSLIALHEHFIDGCGHHGKMLYAAAVMAEKLVGKCEFPDIHSYSFNHEIGINADSCTCGQI